MQRFWIGLRSRKWIRFDRAFQFIDSQQDYLWRMPMISLNFGRDLFSQPGCFSVALKNGIPALNISLHIPETQGLQDTDKVFGRQRISAADIHGSQ